MNYIYVIQGTTAYLSFAGDFYNRLSFVLLSAADITSLPSVSGISYSTTSQKVSAAFPPISGYLYDTYAIQDKNRLSINLINLSAGMFDIILGNVAGYTKLSDRGYLINVVLTPPVFENDLLLENSGRILLENGGNILLE
jgi:hypothetical protein